MFGPSVTNLSLDEVSASDLKQVCATLWDWKYCNHCTIGKTCVSAQCPWSRPRRPETFLRFYKRTTWNVPEPLAESHCALRSHQDLFSIIHLLMKWSRVPRSQLTERHFSTYREDNLPDTIDQDRAFDLALRVLTMVECSGENQSWPLCELGLEPVVWRSDQSVQEFMASAIPVRPFPSNKISKELNAGKLKKLAGLNFRGTDDLSSHLKMDRKKGIVQIFHHTTYLKLSLITTRDQVHPVPDSFSIERQLAIETLQSIQIMFLLDHESREILGSLISKYGFDPDCCQDGSMHYRREKETGTPFTYWGSRLMDLEHKLGDPTPRGFQRLVQRISKERHVMIVTIIAIVLGALGVAVGILQLWISYQQWKHPV